MDGSDEREELHFHIWRAGVQYRFRLRDFQQMPTDTRLAPAQVKKQVTQWAERNKAALQSSL